MEDTQKMSMGQRIAYYRKARNITQEQLGDMCNVSSQAVSKWENDQSAPDIALLARLAEIFAITTDELLGVKKQETVHVAPESVDTSKLFLKINIVDEDGDKVKINLPFSIAEIMLKSGASFNGNEFLKKIDFAQLGAMVKNGVLGKLVDIESEDGDKVEIWVE